MEPSGKIHTADLDTIDGVNIMNLWFMKQYMGQRIQLTLNENTQYVMLINVDVDENGVWFFEAR